MPKSARMALNHPEFKYSRTELHCWLTYNLLCMIVLNVIPWSNADRDIIFSYMFGLQIHSFLTLEASYTTLAGSLPEVAAVNSKHVTLNMQCEH